MPRKPQPPPAIFRIEGLSDGIDRRLVDDFTGLPIEQTVRVIADPQIAIDAGKREKIANQRALLEAVLPRVLPQIEPIGEGEVQIEPKFIPQEITGKRAIVTGKGLSLHLELPPYRRDKF